LKLFKTNNLKAESLLVSVAIFWGVTFLMVQDAIQNVPVFSFLFYRFGFATVLMFILYYSRLKLITKETVISGTLLGFALFAGYSTQTYALVYVSSSMVAFLTGLTVIFVPLLSFVFLKENIKRNVIVASIVSSIGLYYLTMSGSLEFGIGEFLGSLCAFFIALHLIMTGKLSSKLDIFMIVLIQLFVISLLSLMVSLTFEDVTFNIEFDYAFIKAILVTSVFATVYAFIIQTSMQQKVSASKTAVIFTLEPLSAALYGGYIGGEVFLTIQIVGAGFIILATVISEMDFKKIFTSKK